MTTQANHPKQDVKNTNLAVGDNPAKNRRTAQGDGEQPTGAVICGTIQLSHHSRSQEPLGGSRQQGGPVLQSWQYQRAATLVMLSTNWPGRSFGATWAGVWFIEWSRIVHPTAVFGLQVDDSLPLNGDIVCLITEISPAWHARSGTPCQPDLADHISEIRLLAHFEGAGWAKSLISVRTATIEALPVDN